MFQAIGKSWLPEHRNLRPALWLRNQERSVYREEKTKSASYLADRRLHTSQETYHAESPIILSTTKKSTRRQMISLPSGSQTDLIPEVAKMAQRADVNGSQRSLSTIDNHIASLDHPRRQPGGLEKGKLLKHACVCVVNMLKFVHNTNFYVDCRHSPHSKFHINFVSSPSQKRTLTMRLGPASCQLDDNGHEAWVWLIGRHTWKSPY